MAEKSFLNLTCIIQSVARPQGVYWRHNNQLLASQSDGLVTVSPLSRRSNTTFSISLAVWLTSTRQSGEAVGQLGLSISVCWIAGNYQCVPTNTKQAAVLVHVLDGKYNTRDQLPATSYQLLTSIILAGDMLRAMYSNSNSRDLNILQPLCLYLCCYILQIAIPL